MSYNLTFELDKFEHLCFCDTEHHTLWIKIQRKSYPSGSISLFRTVMCIVDFNKPVSYTHLDVYKRQIQGCMRNIIWFCLNLRLLSFAKKKFPLIKKTVAGKLPLSLNRSSPKTIGREYSVNQGCMQKIIWFCLNLRQLSFAIEKNLQKPRQTDRHTHTDTFRKTTFFHVLSVVESESAIISNTFFLPSPYFHSCLLYTSRCV